MNKWKRLLSSYFLFPQTHHNVLIYTGDISAVLRFCFYFICQYLWQKSENISQKVKMVYSCWKAVFYLQFVSNYGGKNSFVCTFLGTGTLFSFSLSPLKAASPPPFFLLSNATLLKTLVKRTGLWWSNVDGQCNQTLNSGTDSVYLYEAIKYADLFFIWFVFIQKNAPAGWSRARGPSFKYISILVFPQNAYEHKK